MSWWWGGWNPGESRPFLFLFPPFKDLKEKKEVVEETENGKDAPANGNAVSISASMKLEAGGAVGRAVEPRLKFPK